MWCENYVIKTVCYAGGLCLLFLRDLGYKVVNGVRRYLAVQTPRERQSSCAYASRVVNLRSIFLFVNVRCMWDLVLISLALYDTSLNTRRCPGFNYKFSRSVLDSDGYLTTTPTM
jgi:hypothetical protein